MWNWQIFLWFCGLLSLHEALKTFLFSFTNVQYCSFFHKSECLTSSECFNSVNSRGPNTAPWGVSMFHVMTSEDLLPLGAAVFQRRNVDSCDKWCHRRNHIIEMGRNTICAVSWKSSRPPREMRRQIVVVTRFHLRELKYKRQHETKNNIGLNIKSNLFSPHLNEHYIQNSSTLFF